MEHDLWSDVELRHLQTLRLIAQTGSFRLAAESLGYAQPAVSQQLAALEAMVGLRLVDRRRGARVATLTEAGEILVRHADAVVARMLAARADLRALAAGSAGTLRVGTYQSVSARILPESLRRFLKRWPRVTVELREGSDDEELLVLLAAGEVDLAFGGVPPDGPFDSVEMVRDAWFLLTWAGSPLARRQAPLTVGDLRDEPLIAFRSTSSTEVRLEEFLRGSGLDPRIVFRTDDNPTVQGLVAAGFGSAFLPALAIDLRDPRLVRIPMDIPPRTLAVAWHRDRTRSPAAAAFVATVLEVCAELDLPTT